MASIKIVFTSEPFDKIERRLVRLPLIDQICFVNAGIFYRYAVIFVKMLINGVAPIRIRFVDLGSFHRILRLAPMATHPLSLKDRLPGQVRQ
jgi:hypothetical protein